MWKRWNNYNGSRGPQIGHPTLIETTVEEGYLETIPEVDSLKSKRSSGSTTLPELPFRAMPPMPRMPAQQHREPIWSQPSPTIPDYSAPQTQSPLDKSPSVSPPSSPSQSAQDVSYDEIPISPIEPEVDTFPVLAPSNNGHRSRIPQRIVSDKNNKDNGGQVRQETRWDAYSGEPTNDHNGLPPTVRPGVEPLEQQYDLKERTIKILAGIREREAAQKLPWGKQPPPVAPVDPLDKVVRKEPWKGASGRTTLVDPVQNNPSARTGPIIHPQRNISRMKQPDHVNKEEANYGPLRTVASDDSIKPVAPLKIATKSRNTSPQSSSGSNSPPYFDTINSAPPVYQHPKSLQSPFSSPGPVRSPQTPADPSTTRADSPPFDPAPETPRTPNSPAIHNTIAPVKLQQMPSEPDESRFSWTTYSTSVAESPGNMARIRAESPPPPLPQMPPLHIKKRPVSGAYVERPFMTRNAYPSQTSIVSRKPVAGNPRPSTGTITSQLSLSKTLPQIPPELEATDKIANLEAQLNALAMRKHNISRIIRDLQESLKRNAIIYDLWKRKDITDRISNQESELQVITNEEHELGLLLHRAQRKKDKEDNYEEPTGLWIRRVTS